MRLLSGVGLLVALAIGSSIAASPGRGRTSLTIGVGGHNLPIVVVDPDGGVVSDDVTTIPDSETFYHHDDRDLPIVGAGIGVPKPGMYAVYTKGLKDEAPSLEEVVLPVMNVAVHVDGGYCGETIEAESGGGLPADVFVYRFLLVLEESGCSVRAVKAPDR